MLLTLAPLILGVLKKTWFVVLIAALCLTAWGYRKAYLHEQVKVASLQAQYEAEHAAATACSDATDALSKKLAVEQAGIDKVGAAIIVTTTQAASRSAQRTTTIEDKKSCSDSLSSLVSFFVQRRSPLGQP